MMKCKNKWI